MYKYEDVYQSTLEYFDRDDLATKVWIDKYALKDQEGNIYELNPDDMHRRLAKEFARIESKYTDSLNEEKIYQLFKKFKYIVPQGSPMFGIGNNYSMTSLSNCFVIGSNYNSDSYGSIMRTDEEQVQIMKRRGGVGHDISHLRPSCAVANNSILKGLSGTTLYMERYSNSTREVSQGDRRGALMLTIDIRHPDVDKFVDKKMIPGKVTGANISVKLNDEFIEAVKNNEDFWQCFPIDLKIPLGEEYDKIVCNLKYDELVSIAGGYLKKIKAKKLWDKIIYNAWKSAEPGLLFWDAFKRESTSDGYEGHEIISVNPCAELCLPAYDSCRLMAINLYSYVVNPFETKNSYFNYDLFKDHVNKAQRLMDDLIDLEVEKIDKIISKIKKDPEDDSIKWVELNLWNNIREKTLEGRRTGLGVTGEGDMLAALGFMYGSVESIKFSENLHKIMAIESYKSSINLANERGTFPIWNLKLEETNPFISRVYSELDEYDKVDYCLIGRRNIANLTIAPTGTVSLMTQTTSGIEPVFRVYYTRRRKVNDKNLATFIDDIGDMWQEFKVIHPKFVEWFIRWNELKLTYQEGLKTLEIKSDQELDILIENSPYYLSTSKDIDYIGKIEMQGAIQKWVDHSISVTVNLPEDIKEQVISDIYMKAHEVGCKGVTVYREGSREGVLISKQQLDRPKEVDCDINHLTINGVKWIVLVGLMNNSPYEVFALKNVDLLPKYKSGKLVKIKSRVYDLKVNDDGIIHNITGEFENPLEGALTRQISLNLKNSPLEEVYLQLQKEGGINDFNKAISRTFKKYLKDKVLKDQCPECGSQLVMESGCVICKNCGGYSKCG